MEDRISIRAGHLVLRAAPTVRVEEVLALRAAGLSPDDILSDLPGVTGADLIACVEADRELTWKPGGPLAKTTSAVMV